MPSRFDEREAQAFVAQYPEVPVDLALRAYTARLLGQESSLVLHGGGNASIKLGQRDLFGEEETVLYIKGSGVDMGDVDPAGFTPMDLAFLCRLRGLSSLTDAAFTTVLETRRLRDPAPSPSVETLLHAFVPHRVVDHTHADSILVLTNQRGGADLVREALGARVAVVPYAIPGLPLAQAVAEACAENADLEAVVVLQHGIFTFGEEVRTAYERMVTLVDRASAFVESLARKRPSAAGSAPDLAGVRATAAGLAPVIRGACVRRPTDGRPQRFIVETRSSPEMVQTSLDNRAAAWCASGVITPDHAIRTKNKMAYLGELPESDAAVAEAAQALVRNYAEDDQQVCARYQPQDTALPSDRDPHPRIVMVAGVGLFALGETAAAARAAADIAEHTLQVKQRADAVGAYEPIDERHVYEMETWPPQRKKIGQGQPPLLHGQVAFVTGAAGAIGVGVADRLLRAGAAVMLSDVDERGLEQVVRLLRESHAAAQIQTVVCDVTDDLSVNDAIAETCLCYGGVDVVVPNAGVAHVARIEDLEAERFKQVIAVNLMGCFNVIRASIPVFRKQASGGNIVVVSSKNVFDPGAAFGAYSASKAGAHQIAKIAALELAELGVRVNLVNPDAVFGYEGVSSKLWDLVGPDRMKARGLDPEGLREYYRQRNLLKVSVQAEHVGNAVVFFASEQSPTTGATLPIDGGVPAAFPR